MIRLRVYGTTETIGMYDTLAKAEVAAVETARACFFGPDVTLHHERSGNEINVEFPFREEDFWAAVKQADQDGCDVWSETHGCPDCGTFSYECACCVRDGCEDCGAEKPVNPECKTCKGHGVIR
jgi:hypothetical protein